MEYHFNNDKDRPKYAWEYFLDVPWDQDKTLGSPILQVLHFYEQLGIEDPLYDAGFSENEITQVIVEDVDLRQLLNGPIIGTNLCRINI